MTESPAAAATAVLYNGQSAEMLVAYSDEETGRLHTIQFQETRGDLGEVERLLQFDWESRAPAGAAVVVPEAGQRLSKLDKYWLMWRSEGEIFGQSSLFETALGSTVDADERTIDRPLVAGNKELHVYGWRGGCLVRHRYGADVKLDVILELDSTPARSISAPVPGDDGGTGFIGFVEEADGSIAATAVYSRNAKVMKVDGRAAGRYRLMGRHRMGVHVGRKTRPALAVVTVSQEDGSYALLEARFDFAKKECIWKRTKLEWISPGDLVSASVYYYKTQDAPEPFVLAVNQAGHLLLPRRRNVRTLRVDAGAGYGYPILTTLTNRYEAVGVGSEITLRKF
jgi:hypothetical protein